MKSSIVSSVFIANFGLCSCQSNPPIASIHRADIEALVLEDCATRQIRVSDERIIDEFWTAVSNSEEASIGDVKIHTGYARAWLQMKTSSDVVYLEIVASSFHGPVLVYDGNMTACNDCGHFFIGLKEIYPEFNWCQAPKIY